jgi:hypothetical protein
MGFPDSSSLVDCWSKDRLWKADVLDRMVMAPIAILVDP